MNLTNLATLWMPEIQSEGCCNLLRVWRRGPPLQILVLGKTENGCFIPLKLPARCRIGHSIKVWIRAGTVKAELFRFTLFPVRTSPAKMKKCSKTSKNADFGKITNLVAR